MQLRYLATAVSFAVVLISSADVHADLYFHHTRNENLKVQIQDDPGRILPGNEYFSFAADTYLFKPWDELPSTYYHGSGYWVNLFGEARPNQDIALNLKLAVYNGASSYGYATQNYLQPFFGLTWDPSFVGGGWNFHFRYGDLDRITFGAGLMLQEKEINGLLLSVTKNDFRYMGIIDGTGAYYPPGDTYYQQIDWQKNLLGVSFMFINYDGENNEVLLTNQGTLVSVPEWGHLAISLFSEHPLNESLFYRAEGAIRNSRVAGMGGIEWRRSVPFRWAFGLQGQLRYYQNGFADQIAGLVQWEYVTPEILDKDYTDPRNIFRSSDDIWVAATRLTGSYWLADWFQLNTSNELYQFRYVRGGYNNVGLYFKDAAALCPYERNRRNCLTAYVSNQQLDQSGAVFATSGPPVSFLKNFNFGFETFVYF